MTQPEFEIAWPTATRAHRREGDRVTKEKVETDPDRVIWKRVTAVHRPKCDVCIQAMEHGAPWFAPDPVAWERRGHGTLAYYCYHHAAPLRVLEGVEP